MTVSLTGDAVPVLESGVRAKLFRDLSTLELILRVASRTEENIGRGSSMKPVKFESIPQPAETY